jgi:DNA (cytosine-5)-methyltransferase 1
MLRVIQEARPAWIVGENVVGIIGLALDQVLFDLEKEGYEVEAIIIPACGVDANHRRNRVWIVGGGGDVANSKDTKRRARQLGKTLASIGTPGNNKSLGCCSVLANPKSQQGSSDDNRPEQAETFESQQSEFRGSNCWELREGNWATEPSVGRVANGIPYGMDRLKGLGNAIVPQVAYQILKTIRSL